MEDVSTALMEEDISILATNWIPNSDDANSIRSRNTEMIRESHERIAAVQVLSHRLTVASKTKLVLPCLQFYASPRKYLWKYSSNVSHHCLPSTVQPTLTCIHKTLPNCLEMSARAGVLLSTILPEFGQRSALTGVSRHRKTSINYSLNPSRALWTCSLNLVNGSFTIPRR